MRAANTKKARLLFVDDEVQILHSMRALFRHDYEVFLATSGNSAVDIVREHDIHVIVSDQRMPSMLGVELLRRVKEVSPNTMRIMLTGYADREAVIGSVNKGEVFRFINKPWDNKILYDTVSQAAAIALRELKIKPQVAANDGIMGDPGILIIEEDIDITTMLESILGNRYQLYFAASLRDALETLQSHYVGVVIAETQVGPTDITVLIKALKGHHPDIVTIVMTKRSDVMMVADLINQGQIFRFLTKPVKPGICMLTVQASMERHRRYRQNPRLTDRYKVEADPSPPSQHSTNIIARIKSLRSRLFQLRRH
ncbi:MAG: response regulator [Gammaproteobacteria bacterium]